MKYIVFLGLVLSFGQFSYSSGGPQNIITLDFGKGEHGSIYLPIGQKEIKAKKLAASISKRYDNIPVVLKIGDKILSSSHSISHGARVIVEPAKILLPSGVDSEFELKKRLEKISTHGIGGTALPKDDVTHSSIKCVLVGGKAFRHPIGAGRTGIGAEDFANQLCAEHGGSVKLIANGRKLDPHAVIGNGDKIYILWDHRPCSAVSKLVY